MTQTGPTSKRAKARSSRNAIRHGVLSQSPVVVLLLAEDPREWERHLSGTIESFKPEGHFETALAGRIASIFWRIKRVERFEQEMTVARLLEIPDHLADVAAYSEKLGIPREKTLSRDSVVDQMRRRMILDDANLAKVMRYEGSLHRQLLQSLHELEALQIRRQGGTPNLARLDITGAPGGG